jgi:2-desacetyl-2-hydroxyethyl bacteriochlorophyllide A dehydrogenase
MTGSLMQAAYLQKPLSIEMKTIPVPSPGAGEVRVRLKMTGICGSDVHLFLGHREMPSPMITGHEGFGYIDSVGAGVSQHSIGDRVVIEPNIACNNCKYCLSGRGNICIQKKVIGLNEAGCFAEYVCIPASHAWLIPQGIHDYDAVMIEPTAVAWHALSVSHARPGDTIAVIGLGAIGLLLTQLALALGFKVLVTEKNQAKMNSALKMGAIECAPSSSGDYALIAQTWSDHEVVAVFECAGSDHSASLATAAAPRGSEIILVGLSAQPASFQPLKIVREGISILPSIIYNHPDDFRQAIHLIDTGMIKPSNIISATMPLIQIQVAMEKAAKGADSKIILTM